MGIYDPDEIGPEVVTNPQPYEPVPPPAAAVVDLVLFSDLCDRTDQAETAAALNLVAKDAQKGHRAGKLSDQQLETIKASVKSKRGALDAPAPPPSEPKADGAREPGEEG
jgi:hypothetical protein